MYEVWAKHNGIEEKVFEGSYEECVEFKGIFHDLYEIRTAYGAPIIY